ncbi:MAG: hypothetical protein EZS28_047488, partial [Streblomastix strix]
MQARQNPQMLWKTACRRYATDFVGVSYAHGIPQKTVIFSTELSFLTECLNDVSLPAKICLICERQQRAVSKVFQHADDADQTDFR